MPFAQFTGTGDGTTTQFQIPFPYVKKDHIVVSLNQVANTNFTYVNDTTIVFSPLSSVATATQETSGAPKNGVEIIISRETPLLNALVDFVDGSTLTAADLDTAVLQLLYGLQEAKDDTDAGINFTTLGLDASNNPIINVQDPTNLQDAVTKNYADGLVAGFFKADGTIPLTGTMNAGTNRITNVSNGTDSNDAVNLSQLTAGIGSAQVSQNAAAASATNAATSETNAATSATNAANSATSAATSAATAANLARRSIFVGFQRLADGTLRMVYNEANDSTVYKAEDFVQNGASHAYFLGEDVLATASPNAPEFSLSNGRLILNI
jgi:hypothetical protein